MMHQELASCLRKQQEVFGISISEIARQAEVSRATITRMLQGDIGHCNFASIFAVCQVLDVDVDFKPNHRMERMNEVAGEKAERLARLARGNCSLENQAISNDTYADTVELLKSKLLAGSRRKLWAK